MLAAALSGRTHDGRDAERPQRGGADREVSRGEPRQLERTHGGWLSATASTRPAAMPAVDTSTFSTTK